VHNEHPVQESVHCRDAGAGVKHPKLMHVLHLHCRCEHFDVLAQPKQRKLCALAMCTLLPLRSAVPLAFLDVLLGCITGACA
jgi:hypothetical protein